MRRSDGLVGPKGYVQNNKPFRALRKPFKACAMDRRTGGRLFVGCYATEVEACVALRAKQSELDVVFEATSEFPCDL